MNPFFQVLTGCDTEPATDIKAAIGRRTAELAPEPLKGEYLYGGSRTMPANLGWRFLQNYGEPTFEALMAGEYDEHLIANYHDAASAEHWYRYEKQWD